MKNINLAMWIPVICLILLAVGVLYLDGVNEARPYLAALLVCFCVIGSKT